MDNKNNYHDKASSSDAYHKTSWKKIRQTVEVINPTLCQIIDELDPPSSYTLYQADYPYGEIIQPKEFSAFAGIVLQYSAEIFYEGFGKIIPRCILQEGDVFGFDGFIIDNHKSSLLNLCHMTAGVRNIVMVPAIGDVMSHKNLVRDFGVSNKPPYSLQEHWHIFKSIVNRRINFTWNTKLLFFTEAWTKRLKSDPAWRRLKTYVTSKKTGYANYQQSLWLMKAVFYHVVKKKNFKPDPFSVDTVVHLVAMACGIEFGFKFTADNQLAPIDFIQSAYSESYKLKYYPLILCPSLYEFSKTSHPVYYSLQYPTCSALSPRARKTSHIIADLNEIQDLLNAYIEELKIIDIGYPFIKELASRINFDFYHTQTENPSHVKNPLEMMLRDPVIKKSVNYSNKNYFPTNGPILRGCISIHE